MKKNVSILLIVFCVLVIFTSILFAKGVKVELFENLFKLWWQLFLSLSTFSKIFIIVFIAIIVLGTIKKTQEN